MKPIVAEVLCFDHDRDYVVILSNDHGHHVDVYPFEEAWMRFAAAADTRSSLREELSSLVHTWIREGELSYAPVNG